MENLLKCQKKIYITVEDLIKGGQDATRFIMLNRSSDAEIDFDFDKVKEKTKDNPLYYVQYCYARISSVFRNTNRIISDEINLENKKLTFNKEEINIFRKIAEWPKCIEIATNKLEPHRVQYIYMSYLQNFTLIGIWEGRYFKRFIEK